MVRSPRCGVRSAQRGVPTKQKMNRKADNELLLDDVFTEAAPADFREATLGQTLRLARRRRRWRQTRQVAGVFVVMALLGIFIWRINLPRQIVSTPTLAKTEPESYELVRTQPLPARNIVTTRPLVAENFIASAAAVKMVQTTTGNYRIIDDDQLLALLASRPAILIRTGKNSEELVFASPEDVKGFPLN